MNSMLILRKLDKNEDGNQWNASKVNSMEAKFVEALFCLIVEVEYGGICYYNDTLFTDNENIFSLEKFQQVFTQQKTFEKSKENDYCIRCLWQIDASYSQ